MDEVVFEYADNHKAVPCAEVRLVFNPNGQIHTFIRSLTDEEQIIIENWGKFERTVSAKVKAIRELSK